MTRLGKVLFLLVALSLLTPLYLHAAEQKAAPTSWKISGELEEACKCNGACPCWFGKKPTHMNCGGHQVHFIDKGTYGNVSLDGLAFARVSQSPDGQAMMDSFGSWVFDYIYIDEKANEAQRKALKEIALAIMPAASPNVEVRYIPITRKIEGKEHRVTLGQHGEFSAHLVEGGLGGPSKIINPPGADPIRKEYSQGETTKLTYTDANQNWNTKDSNYMYTKFQATSEDYAKYGAMMQQKMEEAKKKKAQEHQH
ncbi:DUF1326 domain-containing protein [bacterium]|nr:DUF1326 domain-containing protein [bacterium]